MSDVTVVPESKASRTPTSRRNPFPGEPFFMVPIALLDTGLARSMRPTQIARYVTLLRVANWRCSTEISIDFRSLEELDGISTRTARDVHTKLQEHGLIRFVRTNPHTYRLVPPCDWCDFGPLRPRFKTRHLQVRIEWRDPT